MILLAVTKKLRFEKSSVSNWLIIGLLVVLPMIMIFPFWHTDQMAICSDWAFHSARVQQIYDNIKAGHWLTFIGTTQFERVGSANFLFYPTLFLYPWALLKFIFAPVQAYFVYVLLMYWTTLGIAYWSMYQFSKSKLRSFVFALMYLTVPYHLYLTLDNYVLGEALGFMFLPLVVLGTYQLLVKNQWKVLAVGMTLVIYSHIVSTLISCEVITALVIVKFILDRKIDIKTIINLIKAGCVSLLLILWELIPFVTDYKGVNQPAPGFNLSVGFGQMIEQAANNQPTNNGGIGLVLLIVALFGWHACQTKLDWTTYAFGVIILVMTTSFIPWHYISQTPLATVQFPYRYNCYAALFLSIIGSKLIIQLIKQHHWSQTWSAGLLALCSLFLFFGASQTDIERNQNTHGDVQFLAQKKSKMYDTLHHGSNKPMIVTNQTYNRQFEYGIIYGETDYWPSAAMPDALKTLNWNLKKSSFKEHGVKLLYTKPNKLTYEIKAGRQTVTTLPALAYRHSQVRVNQGGWKQARSDNGLINVETVPHSRTVVSVRYQPSSLYWIAMTISGIAWLVLIGTSIFEHRRI